MEKAHIKKKYINLFSKKEIIPKMHGFMEGIRDLKLEELKSISKDIIRKTKEKL